MALSSFLASACYKHLLHRTVVSRITLSILHLKSLAEVDCCSVILLRLSQIMRAVQYSALVAAAAVSASFTPQQQQVLGGQNAHSVLEKAQETYGPMSEEEHRIWDFIAKEVPDAFENLGQLPPPKPFNRRPDSDWDHIVKGSDIQSVWVENENGERERAIDGKLADYTLRSKSVDPGKLGVDKVKQYSGYLDDDENDKHLFYCMYFLLYLLSVYI